MGSTLPPKQVCRCRGHIAFKILPSKCCRGHIAAQDIVAASSKKIASIKLTHSILTAKQYFTFYIFVFSISILRPEHDFHFHLVLHKGTLKQHFEK